MGCKLLELVYQFEVLFLFVSVELLLEDDLLSQTLYLSPLVTGFLFQFGHSGGLFVLET